MNRKNARLVALTVVGVTVALATLAWGDYTTTSNPGDADNVPIGQTARAVVSIRNTGTATRTITGIAKGNPQLGNCLSQIMPSTLTGTTFPVTLAPNAQLQILVQAAFSSGDLVVGPPGCVFDIEDMSGTPFETFSVTFSNVGGSAWELQPHVMNFGTQSGFEVQTALVLNHDTIAGTYMSAVIMDPTGTFTFQSPCMGLQACAGGTMIASGSAQQLQIKCDPTMGGARTATLGLFGSGGPGSGAQLASMMLTCTGTGSGSGSGSGMIDIVPTMVDISGPMGTPTMVPVMIDYNGSAGGWRMTGADINSDPGNVFAFVASGCSGHTCSFVAPDRALPTTLDITCTPGTTTTTATMIAQGEGGANDFDMATLRCLSGSGGSPTLIASPNPVFAGSYSVNMSSPPQTLTLTNGGSGSLTAQITEPASGEWSASTCVSSPCTLNGFGSATTVDVVFTPAMPGDRSANFVITNNGTQDPVNVGLVGSGSGATLEVTAPPMPSYTIDFGTIPRGSSPQRPLTMLTTGNIPITVDVTAPSAPFSLGATQFSLSPGIPGGTTVTCSSPTAGGPFTQTISFTSNAYMMDTSSITARCEIADTDLEVDPTPFDFGEVRVGSPTAELAFTLRNPSATASLVIHSMRLSSSSAGLSLDAPINTNVTLGPGEVRSARLLLDSGTEVDLAGHSLLISVDSSMLSFPITGKVVRAHVRVVPEELDLGTACVDSQVIGQVLMINDGTATLTMQRPTMTNSFSAVLQDPTDYPAPLFANDTAMVGVTPSASTSGPLDGSLSWDVDAPGAPFQVPIHLEYIADGAAVSPGRVAFGVVAVETRSERKTIRLENCGTAPVTLDLAGIKSRTGGTKVWDVQPNRGTIVLPPDGVQMIGVEFAPLRRGSYAATIVLSIDGAPRPIEIFGDASGPILEPTSFYACSCSGPSAPSRGWPVVLALVLVSRRRRRGSS